MSALAVAIRTGTSAGGALMSTSNAVPGRFPHGRTPDAGEMISVAEAAQWLNRFVLSMWASGIDVTVTGAVGTLGYARAAVEPYVLSLQASPGRVRMPRPGNYHARIRAMEAAKLVRQLKHGADEVSVLDLEGRTLTVRVVRR